MNPVVPLVLCAAAAFLFVLVDAALLASEHDAEAADASAHAHTHRALAFARVLAQLLTGAAVQRVASSRSCRRHIGDVVRASPSGCVQPTACSAPCTTSRAISSRTPQPNSVACARATSGEM